MSGSENVLCYFFACCASDNMGIMRFEWCLCKPIDTVILRNKDSMKMINNITQKILLLLLPVVLLTWAKFPASSPSKSAASVAPTAQANVFVLPEPLRMPGLNRTRTIRVYLPPEYAHTNQRYPVLYMHDAQNLFDAATAYAGEWGVDESLNALAKSHQLEVIVVGIDNGGDRRLTELNPWDNPRFGKAEGREYTDFIVKVVKPAIDKNYRTRPERESTAIMGSSMGGLISHYAINQYPQVFSKAGIFSPAYWVGPQIYSQSAAQNLPADAKLYFYMGGREGAEAVEGMDKMVRQLLQQPMPQKNIVSRVYPEGNHNEAAWRAEFPQAVLWLFDAGR